MDTCRKIKQYAWVVDLLMRRKRLSIEEMSEEWFRSSLADCKDEVKDRKTWYQIFDDIGFIFGIIIEPENRSKNSRWYILNHEALYGMDIENWMMGCIRQRNLLEEFVGMNHRIDIEGFPSENGMLEPVVKAMKGNHKMEVMYKRYGFKKTKTFIVEPYVIKSYKQRFYVLCKFGTGHFYTLAFDRIKHVRVLREKYNYPNDLFAQDIFRDCYGVMVPSDGQQPVDIIIRAKGTERYYLEDTPLHHSQILLRENKDYAEYQVHIYATEDFFGDVMRKGDRLEIMSPLNVRIHIQELLEKSLNPYQS